MFTVMRHGRNALLRSLAEANCCDSLLCQSRSMQKDNGRAQTMNDPRGSLWRKWDLHVHTPESHVNVDFPEFASYVKALFT